MRFWSICTSVLKNTLILKEKKSSKNNFWFFLDVVKNGKKGQKI